MKKRLVQCFFLMLAGIPYLGWKISSFFIGRQQAFMSFSQLCSLWPGLTGTWLRAAFYRLALPGSSQNTSIAFLSTFSSPDAKIGEHVSIGSACNLGWVDIGEQTIIGSHVCITSGTTDHKFDRMDIPIRLQNGSSRKVSVGRDCWIGNASLIMDDVGEGSVIGGGSVVVQAIPPFSIAAGNPARVIRSRLENKQKNGEQA